MCGTPRLKLLLSLSYRSPKQYRPLPHLVSHQNLGARLQLLKTPRALATGHGEVKLVMTRKLPFSWLAFTVLEGVIQPARGGKSKSYPAVNAVQLTSSMSRCAQRYNSGMNIIGLTKHFLAGFKHLPFPTTPMPTPWAELHPR